MVACLLALVLSGVHEDATAALEKLDQLNQRQDYQAMEQLAAELSKRDWSSEPKLAQTLSEIVRELAYRDCQGLQIGQGACYREWADRWPKDSRAPEALFNAVVAFGREQDFEALLAAAFALEKRHPASELTPRALFNASRVLGELGREQEQAEVGERIATRWPKSREAADAIFNAMVVRSKLRQCAQARADAKRVPRESFDAQTAQRVIAQCR